MLSNSSDLYQRPQAAELRRRLAEPRRFIQVVAGPRQVGKTTLVQQLAEDIGPGVRYASADEPTLRGAEWIAQQWEAARLGVYEAGKAGAVLALDEIQKIPGWSETVKRLWDEDTRRKLPLKVLLIGSAPLLIAAARRRASPAASSCCTCRIGRSRKCETHSGSNWTNTFTSAATPALRRWRRNHSAGVAM